MAATTVYKLYRHFVWVVAAEQKRLKDDLVVGGTGVEVEAGEIASRCFERDVGTLVWLCWFGMVARARGSSRVCFAKLPDRIITGQGRGGGGPLSIDELEIVLKAHSDNPVLFAEAILYADSAKAYNRVGPIK